MKLCKTCGVSKPLTDFHKSSINKDGVQRRCKSCNTEHVKGYYAKNVRDARRKFKQRAKEFKARIKGNVDSMKRATGCYFCDETEPVCLDYHHLDPSQKLDCVGRLVTQKNWSKIEAEIAKCVLLCSNCHRKLHAGLLSL